MFPEGLLTRQYRQNIGFIWVFAQSLAVWAQSVEVSRHWAPAVGMTPPSVTYLASKAQAQKISESRMTPSQSSGCILAEKCFLNAEITKALLELEPSIL